MLGVRTKSPTVKVSQKGGGSLERLSLEPSSTWSHHSERGAVHGPRGVFLAIFGSMGSDTLPKAYVSTIDTGFREGAKWREVWNLEVPAGRVGPSQNHWVLVLSAFPLCITVVAGAQVRGSPSQRPDFLEPKWESRFSSLEPTLRLMLRRKICALRAQKGKTEGSRDGRKYVVDVANRMLGWE